MEGGERGGRLATPPQGLLGPLLGSRPGKKAARVVDRGLRRNPPPQKNKSAGGVCSLEARFARNVSATEDEVAPPQDKTGQ